MSRKSNTPRGVREIVRGKEYRIDLRRYGGGEPRFFGTQAGAAIHREDMLHKMSRLRPGNMRDAPSNLRVACDRFLDKQLERCDDGEIGVGELDNKTRHLKQLCLVRVGNRFVGDFNLGDITHDLLAENVRREMSECRAKPTVRRAFVTIKQMMDWCVTRNWLHKSPAVKIKISLKGLPPKHVRSISPAEMACVIQAAPDIYRYQIMFAAYTGLRAGEQVALTWDDLDFEYGYINVRRARKKPGRKGRKKYPLIGLPKTDKSYRTLKMPNVVAQMLREWKMEQPLEMRGNNLVFPSKTGSMADHGNWRKRGLHKACENALYNNKPVAQMTWQDLRHFYASVLIFSKQVSDAEVATFLGHSSIDFTYYQYARYFQDRNRDNNLGNVLDDVFGYKKNDARELI